MVINPPESLRIKEQFKEKPIMGHSLKKSNQKI